MEIDYLGYYSVIFKPGRLSKGWSYKTVKPLIVCLVGWSFNAINGVQDHSLGSLYEIKV